MSRSSTHTALISAGACLVVAFPASAAIVTPEQVTGTAGSIAGGAVGGPVGGFLGGFAGKMVGHLLDKRGHELHVAPPPQDGPVTPVQPERIVDPGLHDRAVDAAPMRMIQVRRSPPGADALDAGRTTMVWASASPPGTLNWQLARIRAGEPPVD